MSTLFPTYQCSRSVDAIVGSSGSPLLDATGTVVALHRSCNKNKGLTNPTTNLAVPINRGGNDFEAFLKICGYVIDKGVQSVPAAVDLMNEEGIVDVIIMEQMKSILAFAWR